MTHETNVKPSIASTHAQFGYLCDGRMRSMGSRPRNSGRNSVASIGKDSAAATKPSADDDEAADAKDDALPTTERAAKDSRACADTSESGIHASKAAPRRPRRTRHGRCGSALSTESEQATLAAACLPLPCPGSSKDEARAPVTATSKCDHEGAIWRISIWSRARSVSLRVLKKNAARGREQKNRSSDNKK
jgi:hypothetical protein